MSPSFTIITAVYNGSSTIADCLESVNSQSVLVERIIIDGASSDNTLELVQHISPHARILTEPDNGIYDAMNKGIVQATGDIIGILNADDFYASPLVLEKVAKAFEDPTVMSCYGNLEYVRESGSKSEVEKRFEVEHEVSNVERRTSNRFDVVRYWKSGIFSPERFYWGWMPPHPTFFVRRSVYERCGLFSLDQGSAADYELMLRLLLKERITTAYIPEVLVRMRVGGASNASLSNRLKANRMDRRAWEVNGLRPYPWTLLLKPVRKLSQWLVKD
jgi:glycosyltransferase involved in cell wall biosynthesis